MTHFRKIDVLFIYCPIVTAVSAHYEVHIRSLVTAIYFHATKSSRHHNYNDFYLYQLHY